MKRLLSVTMVWVLLVALCTGCGTGTGKEAATEGAIKVQSKDAKEIDNTALTDMAARQKVSLTESSMVFVGDGPDEDESGGSHYLVQCDLKGKKVNGCYLDEKLVGVGNGYICYCKFGDGDKSKEVLYTAPIEKTAKGECVNMKKAEKIAEGSIEFNAYVWESYVFYLDDNLYCYSYETKQTKTLGRKNEFKNADFKTYDSGGDVLYVRDGRLYLEVCDEKNDERMLYRVEVQTGKTEKLFTCPENLMDIGYELFAVNNNLVFFDSGDAKAVGDAEKEVTYYICYDIEKKQKTEIKGKDIISPLEEQKLWNDDPDCEYNIDNCFSYGDRLYLAGTVHFPEEMVADCGPSKGDTIKQDKYHDILLSCPWADITDLRYEKASEWIEKNQSWKQYWREELSDAGNHSFYGISKKLDIWEHCGDELLVTERIVTGEGDNERLDYGLIAIQLETGAARRVPKDSMLYRVFDRAYWL
ncbi:MAG: hypothetical protein J1F22_06905 [Lachnospiraceae bacterium]|nr:hypothetical protein [Lachnospiraceae bacterium]